MAETRNKNEQVKDEKKHGGVMIYPDKELREKLEFMAADESRSLSGTVNFILKEYFKTVK